MLSVEVLLIEDSVADAEVFCRFIERLTWGHFTVRRADTLAQATLMLHAQRFDIVVLDLSLPDSDGLDTIAGIREIDNRVPLVILTGSRDPDTVFSAARMRADGYLIKGEYGVSELSHTIQRAIDRGLATQVSCVPIDGLELLLPGHPSINPSESLDAESGARALRALEQERALYAAAVSLSYNPVIMTDGSGCILYVNPAFERVTGFSQQEALGRHPGMLINEDDGEDFFERMHDTLQAGLIWKGHLVNRRKDGELLRMDATTTCVRDSAGQIAHYVVVARDVTDFAELQRQLNQSMRLNSIGQLAGGIAHDFNNILQAIMSYSAFLMEETRGTNSDHFEYASGIHDAGLRAANLTRQLLAFGRKQTLRTEVLDLNELVTGAVKLLARLIGEDIELELELDPSIPPVSVDRSQMEQIIMNLCVNARDAMPHGGRIRIRSEHSMLDANLCEEFYIPRDRRYVQLVVSDTGMGMVPEVLEYIFEPLFTTKEEGKGSGMGLASVYGIVRQHKGAIRCHSTPGAGTTFEVYFPAAQESVAVTESDVTEPADSVPGLDTGLAQRILVAEDDPVVASLASTLLEGAGYAVTMALDGESAYREILMANEPFALVLSDVVMPRGGGAELLDMVMSAPEISPKPFFLLSSGYSSGILEKKELDGAPFEFLQKPYSPATLLTTVRNILETP